MVRSFLRIIASLSAKSKTFAHLSNRYHLKEIDDVLTLFSLLCRHWVVVLCLRLGVKLESPFNISLTSMVV